MKKKSLKQILSLVLSIALVFGTLGVTSAWEVKAATPPEITLKLNGTPENVSNWTFEREKLDEEYQGTDWDNTKKYCFNVYKDGNTTPELMWIELVGDTTYIYAGHNFETDAVPTTSLYIPENTTLTECEYFDDGSFAPVTGGKEIILKESVTIVKVGNVWMQKFTTESNDTEPALVSGSCDDSSRAYVLNIWAPNITNLNTIGTVDGSILVNGVETTTQWKGANSPTYYQLLVPYAAFPYGSDSVTNASLQGSAYVTVKAGTTVGNLTFKKDMYVKICPDTMADGSCLIEQVSETPKDGYFFGSWNYNGNEFRIQFRPALGQTDTSNTDPTNTLYINGQAVTLNCYDDLPYQFRVPWANLGGTSLDTMGTNIVRVPSGITLSDMTLTEDVWLKIVPGTYEELLPTTMSVNTESTYDNENQQYVIRLTPDDGRKVAEPGVSSAEIVVDGTSVAGGISGWTNETNAFVAYVPYSSIETGAKTADDVGKHLVLFPKGSYVGNRILEEDVMVYIDGNTVTTATEDNVGTEPLLLNGTYDDSAYAYVLNLWTPCVTGSEITETIEDSILVNGVETTAIWKNENSSEYYQLLVPYAAFPYGSDSVTNASLQGSAYVTVKAGTTVGNLTFKKDMYVKICPDTMADGSCLIEQVSETPKDGYFFGSWNYTGSEFRIQYRPTTVQTDATETTVSKTIYINGQSVNVSCYANATVHQFKVPWSYLGGESLDTIGNNVVHIPSSTVLGNMTFTEDAWLKIVKGTYEELLPTTMSVNTESTYDNENQQYVIRLTPDDGRKVAEPGVSSTEIVVDGTSVADGISGWTNETNAFVAYVPYSSIETGATTADALGKHLITFPKGSYVGNRILDEDVTVYIHGTTVSTVVNASLGSDSGYQDDELRYVIWIVPGDGVECADIIGKSTTILVDGEERSGKWFYNEGASLALEVKYDTLQSGATSYENVGRHLVTLPAGTDFGGRIMGNDLQILIDKEDVKSVAVSKMNFWGNGNDEHFVMSFWPVDGRTTIEPVNPDRTIYIDGKEVANGINYWFKDGDVYKAVLKFYTLESGAGSYSELSTHCVMIPKGTYVGDVIFAEDVYVKTYNHYAPVEITEKITMDIEGSAAETNGYKISLNVDGISNATALAGANPNLYVEGTETKNNSISYETNDTDTIDLILPYSVVKKGATSAEDITQPYMITIPKGILLNDVVLTKPVSFVVSGSKVIGVVDKTTVVTLDAHESNGTSGKDSLKFTTSPSDVLSVGASYQFLTGGISVDGKVESDLQLMKEADGLYSIDFTNCNIENGTVVVIDGTVQEGSTGVTFTRTCFRYRTSSGWSLYEEPAVTEITLSNDTINGARDGQIIYMNASSDPLPNGDYSQSSFTFEDNDGEVRHHGGIKVNNEYPESVKLTKKWDGYWCIDVSNMIGSLEIGSIITLEGTLCSGNNHAVFNKISYIYNVDGSFSQYDDSMSATQNQTVTLPEVWVNIDKYTSYDMASAPLVQNGSAELRVNDKTAEQTTLSKAGNYEVTRVIENAVKAEVVGGQPKSITYQQVVHLYETGDANGDGVVTVADIVRQLKNEGRTENIIKSGSDLNDDGVMNEEDKNLLVDLILERKTPEEIYSACEDVVIGAISDMHYLANGRDGQNRINTIKALNYYKSQNADVIIFNADITDLGEVAAYQELVEDIKTVYPSESTRPTMIFTGDNHEWYDVWEVNGHKPVEGETFYTLQERFNTQLSSLRGGLEDSNSHYVIDGYHFIGVSSDGMNGGYSTYDSDTLTWLEERLKEANAADSTKPIFLAIHQAPANTVVGSDASHYYSEALDDILVDYPQLVVITSHTHASIDDEKSIYQGDYTVLNTASLYYVGNITGSVDEGLMSEKYQFAQGLLIRANNNLVDVERCDFYNDTKIKDNWTFTAGENTKYTDERAEQSDAPGFASNASAVVEWKDSTTISLEFDAVADKKSATSYVINVYMDGYTAPIKTRTISSLYWCGEKQIPDTYTVDVEGLSQQKNYQFEILATNCWNKTSEPLTTSYEGMDTEGHSEIDVQELLTLKHTLRTDENGDFKVLVLSDVQSNSTVLEEDIQENIKMMVDKENPDLVLFGGDNSYGMNTEEKLRSYLNSMVGYLEEQKIPWAHVYGNHDDQNEPGVLEAMINEEQQSIYESYDYCLSKAGDPGVFGVGNFVLPVLNHDNDKIAFNVWCLDTGSYLKEKLPNINYNGNTFYGHYEYIQKSQINWYSEASKALEEYNNGTTIPGMMLFHIPLQENYIAWDMKEEAGLEYSGQVYYGGICSAAVNKGLFDEVVERGDVKVIVSAHDHMNDYMVKYQNVALCGSSTIGTVNEFDPTKLGGRVVTYSANETDKVQTEMSYLYTELPEESTPETTKVTITGINTSKISLWTNEEDGRLNKIYLNTDVTGEIGTRYRDKAAQIHHYQPSAEVTYGVSTDIGWSAENELYIQSYTQYKDGDIVVLPKGMTFTIGNITYELTETYRLTCSGGTSLAGAKGDDPIQISLTGFGGWNKDRCTYYLTTNYAFNGQTWKLFQDNGANLYYGPAPVRTGLCFTGDSSLYIQNGNANILDGTTITVPKGFCFSQNGVLFEIAETARFKCVNGSLVKQ